MTPKKNNASQQGTAQTSANFKSSPNSNPTGKDRDSLVPSKDKSPDDLEILD